MSEKVERSEPLSLEDYRKLIGHYLDRVADRVEEFAHLYLDVGGNVNQVASDYLKTEAGQRFESQILPMLKDEVAAFWGAHGASIRSLARVTPGVRARFSGDIGPRVDGRQLVGAATYFDTILVPDPLEWLLQMSAPPALAPLYYLKYAATLVLHQNLYLADVSPPIAMLVPSRPLLMMPRELEVAKSMSQAEAVWVFGEFFGRSFQDREAVRTFLRGFRSSVEAAQEVARPELFVFDGQLERDPRVQMEKAVEVATREYPKLEAEEEGAVLLSMLVGGRLLMSSEHLAGSADLNAEPLLGASESAHWMRLKVGADRSALGVAVDGQVGDVFALTNGLLTMSEDWLGRLTIEELR